MGPRVVATLVALTVLLPAGPADGRPIDRIAFTRQSERFIPLGILTIRPGGGGEKHVRARPAEAVQWSPDRSLIGFTRQTCESNRPNADCDAYIYTVRPDGSGLRRFAGNADAINDFDWSPDGRRIVYSAFQDDSYDLRVSDGRSSHVLTGSPDSYEMSADWSPDGETIAFVRDSLDVFTIPAGGGEERNLTNDEHREGEVRWAPDGSRIAFVTTRDDTSGGDDGPRTNQLYVMDPDGSDPLRVSTNPGLFKDDPQWSRDSRFLTWFEHCGVDACVPDLWVGAADGSSTRNITQTPDLYEEFPQWSRDGSRLVFTRWRRTSAKTDLFSIRVDGTGLKRLTDPPGPEPSFDWQSW